MSTTAAENATALQSAALMAHVQEFTKRVKLSGTPEELESFHYLQRVMESYGFRARLLMHDAYISLPGKAAVEVDNAQIKAITHSFSRPSPAGGLTAPVAYLGEGGEQDFAGRDLRGKIVLVEGIASPGVATRAREAGAAGQLHISPNENRYEMCISPVWGSPSPEMMDLLPATVACTIAQAEGTALRDRVQRGEQPRVTLHAEVDTGWRKTPVLEAQMDAPAAAADGPFLLLSGHHDTWYYGVMDNGTANATMLEAARVLASRHAEWRRGLRVCFWSGHSHGRYSGSAWYVDEHWDELERRCVAHVNVDSTGGVGADVMTASAVSSELAGLARRVVQEVTGQIHAGKRSSRSSDASFWGVGIPSMFGSVSQQAEQPGKMRNALGWWWHTPHDTLDKIDPVRLVRDTEIVTRACAHLLMDRVLPLDQAAQVETLLRELASIEGPSHLQGLAGLATSVRDKAVAARRLAESGSDLEAERVNHAMLRAARALVPLDYTSGERFGHDPALPQPAWPALQGLRSPAGGNAELFASVAARRARNRVMHALREAEAALASALG